MYMCIFTTVFIFIFFCFYSQRKGCLNLKFEKSHAYFYKNKIKEHMVTHCDFYISLFYICSDINTRKMQHETNMHWIFTKYNLKSELKKSIQLYFISS